MFVLGMLMCQNLWGADAIVGGAGYHISQLVEEFGAHKLTVFLMVRRNLLCIPLHLDGSTLREGS